MDPHTEEECEPRDARRGVIDVLLYTDGGGGGGGERAAELGEPASGAGGEDGEPAAGGGAAPDAPLAQPAEVKAE